MKVIKSKFKTDRLFILLLATVTVFLTVSIFLYIHKAKSGRMNIYDAYSYSIMVPEPVFSISEGIVEHPFELEITAPSGYEIYYTMDGSVPNTQSCKYNKRITIDPNKNNNRDILYIPTSLRWRVPYGKQNHATVVRARCFKNGEGYGKVKNAVYSTPLIRQHKDFQIVHILIDADSLFSQERGIYVLGEKYYSKRARISVDSLPNFNIALHPANYHRRGVNSIRPAEIILTDEAGKTMFEQSINLRIHGNYTRSYPLKSLRILADNLRGDSLIRFPFLRNRPYNEFKHFILRSSGSDQYLTMFRDAMVQQMVKDIGLDIQEYTPAVVYINGNYWGIHNIRERMDNYYVESFYGASVDMIDVLSYDSDVLELLSGREQALKEFKDLIVFVNENSLSADETAYNHVCSQIDIDNFIDYMIAETFFANDDWINNNIRLYRIGQQTETMRQKNIEAAKWRWMMVDLDDSMEKTSLNMFERLINERSEHFISIFFLKLLENPNFKEKFLARYDFIIGNYLNTQKLTLIIENFEKNYENEIVRHIDRWRRPSFFQSWQSNVNTMKVFVENRPEIVLEQLKTL